MPPTQRLGQVAYDLLTITGFRYPGAQDDGVNLVVFTERMALNPATWLESQDDTGELRQRLP